MLPAALKLMLKLRAIGLCRRVWHAIASPRKAFLTFLGALLALIWLGNAMVSIMFRDPYSPETFRRGLLLSLFGYGVWPLLKSACKRPEQAIEWTPAEQEFLRSGPFTRQQLIRYRLHVILSSTIVKAIGVSLLLLPDLQNIFLGFLGVLLALIFLELTRLTAETFFWGLPQKIFQPVRLITLTSVGSLGALCATQAMRMTVAEEGIGPVAFRLILNFFHCLKQQFNTSFGSVATSPLSVFVELIASAGIHETFALNLGIASILLGGMYFLLLEIDRLAQHWTTDEERTSWKVQARAGLFKSAPEKARLPWIPNLDGAGPLAWRQLQGARKYSSSLVISLVIPAALSCLPLLLRLAPLETFVNVAGSLVFYSFLLLPSALKFDFRRDCDRLAILKTLPIRPLSIVLGQLATPIALTLLVQVPVLCLAWMVKPVPISMLVWSLLLLFPTNLLIFGLENWFFLIFPHRIHQEGVQIFLRSILMFTAKGLLFAAAMTLVFLWGISCRSIASWPLVPDWVDHRMVFGIGIWLMTLASGGVLLWLIAKAYKRFDPSLDLPA